MTTIIKLTVLFDTPFWVGIFEISDGSEIKICKVSFGSEPREQEVYEFLLRNLYNLRFSNPLSIEKETCEVLKVNPKRLQREIKKQCNTQKVGTKAQLAMKLQHEELKLERNKKTKDRKVEEEERKFMLKKMKRLQKHKGH